MGSTGDQPRMNVLITGAGGFIGQLLSAALVPNADTITLTDMAAPPIPKGATTDRVKALAANLTDKATVDKLFTADLTHVYLLHGIMSGAAEANYELGLRVNFDSMRLIADALAKHSSSSPVRVVFPSSLAVFGPSKHGDVVTEATMPSPQSSYGAQKAMVELLLNDMSRRGAIDARILRLPTIIVRPGKPTGAASSFCSGILREPLNGEKGVLPVGDDLELWVCSTRTIIRNLVMAGEVSSSRLGSGSRILNMPGKTVTVAQMIEALGEVGGKKASDLIERQPDENVAKIVGSWPAKFNCSRARELGFLEDVPLGQILKDYVEDFMQ